MSLAVAIITKNEEANIRRTLESVKWADEIVVVDSGSTDKTCEIAREYGAKVFVEEWKGFAKQKNSAIEKCTGEWILSLDADEEVDTSLKSFLTDELRAGFHGKPYPADLHGFYLRRRNFFLGQWVRHGGFYPDWKIRVFKRNSASFQERAVHETVQVVGTAWKMRDGHIIHHAYPTLSGYIEHMNRYSDLGAEMVVEKKAGERGASAGSREQSARAKSLATEPLEKRGKVGFSFINIVIRPLATFIYNYFFRLGFLDGKEGLLLHLYHSVYVSCKYATAWELSRAKK
jgi:glycosyltransferase involved in cell wall biosynthesis